MCYIVIGDIVLICADEPYSLYLYCEKRKIWPTYWQWFFFKLNNSFFLFLFFFFFFFFFFGGGCFFFPLPVTITKYRQKSPVVRRDGQKWENDQKVLDYWPKEMREGGVSDRILCSSMETVTELWTVTVAVKNNDTWDGLEIGFWVLSVNSDLL